MASLAGPEDILTFWIGPLDTDGLASDEKAQRWFDDDEEFDELVRSRFEDTWRAGIRGELNGWLDSPRGRLAYVVLLDQFSRNMFRGNADAYDGDKLALAAAREALRLGHDRELRGDERVFMYLPFMHTENLAVQDQSVQLFRAFRDQSSGRLRKRLDNNVDFAERHREVIAKWGRFPQRNAPLGRTSTGAEFAFLSEPGSTF
jgi:uncharacterized protein (DUF924 family)